MWFDHYRMKNRIVLNKDSLIENYRFQFYPIHNLHLIGLQSGLRVRDIASFPVAQGRLYGLRDMREDWDKGLINIPEETLTTAGLNPCSSFSDVQRSPAINEWIQEECGESAVQLNEGNEALWQYFTTTELEQGDLPENERLTQIIFAHLNESPREYLSNRLQ